MPDAAAAAKVCGSLMSLGTGAAFSACTTRLTRCLLALPLWLLSVQTHRCWVGPCAGIEWALRFFPAWLQDALTARAMGLLTLTPVLQQNAAALRTHRQQAAGAAR